MATYAQSRQEMAGTGQQLAIYGDSLHLLTPLDPDFGWCVGHEFAITNWVAKDGNSETVVAKLTWHAVEHDRNDCAHVEPNPQRRSELIGSVEKEVFRAVPGQTIDLPPESRFFTFEWVQDRNHFDEQKINPKGIVAEIELLLLRKAENHFSGAHAVATLKGFKVIVTSTEEVSARKNQLKEWLGEWVFSHALWDIVLSSLAFVIAFVWGFVRRLNGPILFIVALIAAFLVLILLRVFGVIGGGVSLLLSCLAIWRLIWENKHAAHWRHHAPAQRGSVVPTSSSQVVSEGVERAASYTIRFDFLPGNPLDNDWIWRYPKQRPANYLQLWAYSRPTALHQGDGLRIVSQLDFYAIGHYLPNKGPAYDRIAYEVEFSPDTMVWVQLDLSSQDEKTWEEKWVKFYRSTKGPIRAEKVPNYSDEYTIWIPARPLRHNWWAFNISIEEVMGHTWGTEGWVFKRIKMFSFRGNISISPVEFRLGRDGS